MLTLHDKFWIHQSGSVFFRLQSNQGFTLPKIPTVNGLEEKCHILKEKDKYLKEQSKYNSLIPTEGNVYKRNRIVSTKEDIWFILRKCLYFQHSMCLSHTSFLRDRQLSLTCPSNTPVTVIYHSVPIIKIKGTLPSWRMQGTEQESCHLLAQEATKPVWQRWTFPHGHHFLRSFQGKSRGARLLDLEQTLDKRSTATVLEEGWVRFWPPAGGYGLARFIPRVR